MTTKRELRERVERLEREVQEIRRTMQPIYIPQPAFVPGAWPQPDPYAMPVTGDPPPRPFGATITASPVVGPIVSTWTRPGSFPCSVTPT